MSVYTIERRYDMPWPQDNALADIKDIVRRGVCSPVDANYVIYTALNHGDVVLYTKSRTGLVSAFLIGRWRRPYEFETMVVCSNHDRKGSSKPLILESFRLARERKARKATLTALGNVRTYYPKFGYVDHSDVNNDLWYFVKNLSNTKNYYKEDTAPVEQEAPQEEERARRQPQTPVVDPPEPPAPAPRRQPRPSAPAPGKYPVGAVVLARVPGHPWWPAQVRKPTDSRKRLKHSPGDYFVVFWGSKTYAWTRAVKAFKPMPPETQDAQLKEAYTIAELALASGCRVGLTASHVSRDRLNRKNSDV